VLTVLVSTAPCTSRADALGFARFSASLSLDGEVRGLKQHAITLGKHWFLDRLAGSSSSGNGNGNGNGGSRLQEGEDSAFCCCLKKKSKTTRVMPSSSPSSSKLPHQRSGAEEEASQAVFSVGLPGGCGEDRPETFGEIRRPILGGLYHRILVSADKCRVFPALQDTLLQHTQAAAVEAGAKHSSRFPTDEGGARFSSAAAGEGGGRSFSTAVRSTLAHQEGGGGGGGGDVSHSAESLAYACRKSSVDLMQAEKAVLIRNGGCGSRVLLHWRLLLSYTSVRLYYTHPILSLFTFFDPELPRPLRFALVCTSSLASLFALCFAYALWTGVEGVLLENNYRTQTLSPTLSLALALSVLPFSLIITVALTRLARAVGRVEMAWRFPYLFAEVARHSAAHARLSGLPSGTLLGYLKWREEGKTGDAAGGTPSAFMKPPPITLQEILLLASSSPATTRHEGEGEGGRDADHLAGNPFTTTTTTTTTARAEAGTGEGEEGSVKPLSNDFDQVLGLEDRVSGWVEPNEFVRVVLPETLWCCRKGTRGGHLQNWRAASQEAMRRELAAVFQRRLLKGGRREAGGGWNITGFFIRKSLSPRSLAMADFAIHYTARRGWNPAYLLLEDDLDSIDEAESLSLSTPRFFSGDDATTNKLFHRKQPVKTAAAATTTTTTAAAAAATRKTSAKVFPESPQISISPGTSGSTVLVSTALSNDTQPAMLPPLSQRLRSISLSSSSPLQQQQQSPTSSSASSQQQRLRASSVNSPPQPHTPTPPAAAGLHHHHHHQQQPEYTRPLPIRVSSWGFTLETLCFCALLVAMGVWSTSYTLLFSLLHPTLASNTVALAWCFLSLSQFAAYPPLETLFHATLSFVAWPACVSLLSWVPWLGSLTGTRDEVLAYDLGVPPVKATRMGGGLGGSPLGVRWAAITLPKATGQANLLPPDSLAAAVIPASYLSFALHAAALAARAREIEPPRKAAVCARRLEILLANYSTIAAERAWAWVAAELRDRELTRRGKYTAAAAAISTRAGRSQQGLLALKRNMATCSSAMERYLLSVVGRRSDGDEKLPTSMPGLPVRLLLTPDSSNGGPPGTTVGGGNKARAGEGFGTADGLAEARLAMTTSTALSEEALLLTSRALPAFEAAQLGELEMERESRRHIMEAAVARRAVAEESEAACRAAFEACREAYAAALAAESAISTVQTALAESRQVCGALREEARSALLSAQLSLKDLQGELAYLSRMARSLRVTKGLTPSGGETEAAEVSFTFNPADAEREARDLARYKAVKEKQLNNFMESLDMVLGVKVEAEEMVSQASLFLEKTEKAVAEAERNIESAKDIVNSPPLSVVENAFEECSRLLPIAIGLHVAVKSRTERVAKEREHDEALNEMSKIATSSFLELAKKFTTEEEAKEIERQREISKSLTEDARVREVSIKKGSKSPLKSTPKKILRGGAAPSSHDKR